MQDDRVDGTAPLRSAGAGGRCPLVSADSRCSASPSRKISRRRARQRPAARAARQALFTIRVELRPLAVAVDGRERAARLHDTLASMSQAVLDYRGLTDARDRLLDWLAADAR